MRVLIAAFSVLIAAAIVVNLVFALVQGRKHVLTEQSTTAHKLTRVLEEQTASSVDAVELALQASTRSVQLLSSRSPDRQAQVQSILEGNLRNLPFVRALWILDSKGDMIHDSEQLVGRYNLSDRKYFQIHRDNPATGLYIDRPILSKHGVWFIGLSRRINLPDGSFGGVIVAAFEPKYFERFYESIRIGKDGIVSLLGADGTLMLRVPLTNGEYGKKLDPLPKFVQLPFSGNVTSYRAKSSVDGVERLYAARHVRGRPLVVTVGIGQDEALTAWRASAQTYVMGSVAFLLVIAVLAYLTLQELHKRSALNVALRESEAAMAEAQRLSSTGSWRIDLPSKRAQWSLEMYRLLGLNPLQDRPSLEAFFSFLHPDDRDPLEQSVHKGSAWSGEVRSNPARGAIRHFHVHETEVRDAGGNLAALAGILQEVTERRQVDDKLRLAARVFEHIRDGIIIADEGRRIVAVNAAFERITGFGEAQVLGLDPGFLQSDRHDAAFQQAVWDGVNASGQWRGEIWNRRKSGEVYPAWVVLSAMHDAQNRRNGYVAVFADLSDITHANEQLAFLVNHDPLTRLPNRSLLKDRLEQAVSAARADGHQCALLLLNIDRLHRINESIGHDAGDALLEEVAQRLLGKVGSGDTLARLGSDEFVLLLTQFDNAEDLITRTHRLLETVATPCIVHGHTLTVTASIGIAIYPGDGNSPGELLKNADAALSHVKQAGRDGFRFFTAEMNVRALQWVSLEHQLRGAMGRDELSLHYQPKVNLQTGRICGAEALMRWHTATMGAISPADFIPIAEDTGLIIAMGEWAIRTVCAQNSAWQAAGLPMLPIAVNVSAHQFAAGTLPSLIRQALQASDLPPECLEIELTESVLMTGTDMAMQQITELRNMGVKVSLDDFGTGYSSLAYLSRFPLDKLKIDQCFVRDIITDTRSGAIVDATIALAHGLGLVVIAEGVETAEQMNYLRDIGCDEIQGFLISRPVSHADFAALLESNAGFSLVETTTPT